MAEITDARIVALEKCLDEHDQFINGNGRVGAKTQLALIDDRLETIEKKLDQLNGAATGLLLTAVGSIVVYILLNVIPHVAR